MEVRVKTLIISIFITAISVLATPNEGGTTKQLLFLTQGILFITHAKRRIS
ncbi:MAG: hypothetical protein WBZ36_13615 [Candidatus Nitrosopolaris sp.]